MKTEDIRAKLASALAAEVEVNDMTGTGDHFEARIVSPLFEGKSPIERHQMVYAPFQAELASGELHAFTLKTLTPMEAKK